MTEFFYLFYSLDLMFLVKLPSCQKRVLPPATKSIVESRNLYITPSHQPFQQPNFVLCIVSNSSLSKNNKFNRLFQKKKKRSIGIFYLLAKMRERKKNETGKSEILCICMCILFMDLYPFCCHSFSFFVQLSIHQFYFSNQ